MNIKKWNGDRSFCELENCTATNRGISSQTTVLQNSNGNVDDSSLENASNHNNITSISTWP